MKQTGIVTLPITGVDIAIHVTPEMMMTSMVSSFSDQDIDATYWSSLSDTEQLVIVSMVIRKCIDNLVQLGCYRVSRKTKRHYANMVRGKLHLMEVESGESLSEILKDNTSLKRNCFREILADEGELMYLWAKTLEVAGIGELLGGDKDFIQESINGSMV